MTTRKIEGLATYTGSSYAFAKTAIAMLWHPSAIAHPATLIIGGKGYTVEEVRAMLDEMINEADTCYISDEQNNATDPRTAVWYIDMKRIAAKHGITL